VISKNLKITIITVVYNGAETIEKTLQSVAGQTYSNIEHIIIDGGSTDGTLDIIQKYMNGSLILHSGPDKGMYDAMNKGLVIASGDIVGFLNADDFYISSDVLETIVQTLDAQKVDACFGDLVYVDKNDPDKVVRYWRSNSYSKGLFEKGWMPAHPTFYARRWVYEKYGGYNLTYRYQSDFELTMRFLEVNKVNSAYIPRMLVKMRSGGASRGLWHILVGNIEAYRACRRHSLNVTPLFIVKKILSRVPQFFQSSRLDTRF